jgi:uncharacterized repeat protein (TIGR01451 family)
MKSQFYSVKALFFSLCLTIGIGRSVNGQTLTKSAENWSTGGDGTTAMFGNLLVYTIVAEAGGEMMTNATLTDIIPAGTAYVPASTTLNGNPVADISGIMPFAAGGSINSPSASPGTLVPGNPATIVFWVKITANGQTVTNTASLQGTNSSGSINTSSNAVPTAVTADASCNVVFQVTGSSFSDNIGSTAAPYLQIKLLDLLDGTAGTVIYNGANGRCKDALTNVNLTSGTLLKNVSAMAFDRNSLRLYFVNNSTTADKDLCYVDVFNPTPSNIAAYRYTGFTLETNTGTGYNITRMTVAADGKHYALTDNAQDLISFSINASNSPAITRSGALVNDAANGAHDVLTESGGDIFSDGSNKLYLIPNSGNVYKIDPATRVATYQGTISGMPARGCNSLAIDVAGNIYMGGAYIDVYKVSLTTMTLTSITGGSLTNIWTSGDFASCGLPVQPLRVATGGNEPAFIRANEEVAVRVQPNPFYKDLNLQVSLNTAEVVRVRLIDFYGRTVYATSEKLGAGVNSLRLPVPAGLGTGMYVLELWAGNNRLLQKKLLKQ